MMWVEEGQYSARGVLVDLHIAVLAANSSDDTSISGTPFVRAYSLDESAQWRRGTAPIDLRHTEATDIESVFISLLHVLSGGEALPWRHLGSGQIMRAVKGTTMFDPVRWKLALQHCPAQYHDALGRLHSAIYKSGSVQKYMQEPVTAQEALQIFDEEADRLGRKRT